MFRDIKCVVFDVDGVLVRGSAVIEDAETTFNQLTKKYKCLIFTNNSSKSRKTLAKKLNSMGFEVDAENIITSSYLAAEYCRKKGYDKIHYVGGKGIETEMELVGIWTADTDVQAVVVGIDFDFTYRKLTKAMELIKLGAEFIATNTDHVYPVEENRLLPGGGSIVAAIQTASEVKPVVLGKPKTFGLELIANKLGLKKHEILVVGDRIDTDIRMAKDLGARSALALTGVHSEEHEDFQKYRPDVVIENISKLKKIL